MLKKSVKLITAIAMVISLSLTITPLYSINAQGNDDGAEQYLETSYQLFNPNYTGDAAWLNDFELEEDPATAGKVILVKYVGDDESLTIPAKATIGANEYDVTLCDFPEHFLNTSGTIKNTTTKSITFDHEIDTRNVTDTSNMFINCTALETIDFGGFDTNNVENMSGMFAGCSSLTSLDLSSFNTAKVARMDGLFTKCSSLTSLDLSSFNTENVTNMAGMFLFCESLTSLNLSSFNTEKVTNMALMFEACASLPTLDVSNFNTQNVTNMSGMFGICDSLTSLDLSNFNTENVTNMSSMFYWSYSLTSLDLRNFNTDNVTTMRYMFYECSSLNNLDISSFNTEKVTDLCAMFVNCSSLTSLDVSNFNTESATEMDYIFAGCSSLTSIDVSSFNTENAANIGGMFSNCSSLSSIDVSNFNTENVTNIYRMFNNCSSLINLDLSSFNLSKLDSSTIVPENTLIGCSSLQTIKTPVNLQKDISLPGTFVRQDNPNISYTYLPTNTSASYTIVKGVDVTGITVSPTSKTIKVGENFIITPTVTPTSATDKKVTWSSSNNAIASVDTTGKVTGLNTGTATITATTHDGGLKAACTVTVSNTKINVTGISLSPTTKTMGVGGSFTIIPTITPSNATDKSITWFSGNPSVATVDANGKVTALGIGTAVITATTNDGGYKTTCTVTVSNNIVNVTGVTMIPTSRTMYAGDSYHLDAIVSPDNATDKSVTWTSSNPAIATIDENGIVSALKAGTTTITATTNDGGFKANCIITVTGEVVNVTGITLSPTTKTMYAGESSMLMPTITPDNATNKSVTWTSSDPTIASVDENGIVNAIKKGTATITAKTDDGGFTATCVITVNEGDKKVTGISLTPTTNTIKPGDSFVIIPTITPVDAADKSVTWSSSDSSIAKVDSTGKVTALKAGTATITATTNDGGYKATCTVTVANITNIYIYRLYNPNSGEHFFTNNDGERKYLASIGWDDEGVAWMSPSASDVPVYRLYNPYTGEHHYTSNLEERNYLVILGWNDEGIGWYSVNYGTKGTPIYRLFNPYISGIGAHHYTKDDTERDYLRTVGWNYEGIGWYGI